MSRLEMVTDMMALGSEDPRRIGVSHELFDVGQGVGFIESQGNAVAIKSQDGIVLVDVGMPAVGEKILRALRGWTDDPISHIVYTHGHLDHVGGGATFLRDAESRKEGTPEVMAHAALPRRLARYRRTQARNLRVNRIQFRTRRDLPDGKAPLDIPSTFLPDDVVEPTRTYHDVDVIMSGKERIELIHHRGETDDATWLWLPERGMICAGDLWLWVFPNAGNPQKAMRYPGEWAEALRHMVSLQPELLLPGHGLPIKGREAIATALGHVAEALELLIHQVVELINKGATFDEVLQRVKLPARYLEAAWSRPVYDEPEFIIHNIWREYAGWWDGRHAELKPAPVAELTRELSELIGGPAPLLHRAAQLLESGELRLACHLVDLAHQAAGDTVEVHALRARIYHARLDAESSEMARGIYLDAVVRSTGWLEANGAAPLVLRAGQAQVIA